MHALLLTVLHGMHLPALLTTRSNQRHAFYSGGANQALHCLAMHCLLFSNLRCCLTPALIQGCALERRRQTRPARRAPPHTTLCAVRKRTCRRPRPRLRRPPAARTRPPRARRTRCTWPDMDLRRPRLRTLRPPPGPRARRCFLGFFFYFLIGYLQLVS